MTVAVPRGRTAALLASAVAALLVLLVPGAPPARAADAVPTTYAGATYPAFTGAPPTADKPQSKLWWNDGSWWALMRTSSGVTIHRLDPDHVWRDTGTVVDERPASTGDALWENGRLYVASRVSGGASRAVAFTYAGGSYTLDFSRQVSAGSTESMSIARDSTGRLWVAYTQGSRVYAAHTTTSDSTWAAPFLVPVPDNSVAADDIAAIIAFGRKVGVMWSDQANDVMRFAVHDDAAAPTEGWTSEDALAGPNWADDHINLKSLQEDDQGRIFAAVKTSRGDDNEPVTDPSIVVLQRTATGSWTYAVAATVADDLTRPQIALDTTNRRLYVVMADEGGGSVYYKASPLGALTFPGGTGTPFVQWSGASINDPSTTKQSVNATTGLVVLASDDSAHRYYHGELPLAGSDNTAPTVPQGLAATATSATSVGLTWSASTDDVGVTDYRVFRDGRQVGTASGTSYNDPGLTAGSTHTYTVAAADAAGNVSVQSAAAQTTVTDPGPGPVSFVGSASAAGSGLSTSVAAPAGATTGDLLVAAVSTRGVPTITAPAGWTSVRVDSNGTTMRQALFVRPATDANESTWTLSKAHSHVVQVLAYRGVDLTTPVIASAGALSTTAAITSPAVTSEDGAQVVSVAAIARATTLDPSAPLTERSEVTVPSTVTYKMTADAADTTAQATTSGPYTTAADGNAAGVGQTVALRAGSPPPPADETAPSVPTGVTGTAPSPTSARLAWQPSSDDVGVTGYRVYRDGALVGSPAGTSFDDSGLTAATTYSYTVAALDAAGNTSAQSAPVTVTTPPAVSPVTFVASATGTSTTTSTSVASPVGIRAGDVLVAAVSLRGSATITPGAGWTRIRTDAAGTSMRQALYVSVATGSDAASTWTLSRAQTTVVQVLAYRGVSTTDPVIGSAGAASTTATIVSPQATSVAGAQVVTFAGIARRTALTPASPLTERSEITSASTATYKLTADSADTRASGATAGPYTTSAGASAGGVGQTLTLRPAA